MYNLPIKKSVSHSPKKKKNLLADIDLTKIVSTTELQMEHNIHYKKNKEAMYCLLTFCSPHAPLPISAV